MGGNAAGVGSKGTGSSHTVLLPRVSKDSPVSYSVVATAWSREGNNLGAASLHCVLVPLVRWACIGQQKEYIFFAFKEYKLLWWIGNKQRNLRPLMWNNLSVKCISRLLIKEEIINPRSIFLPKQSYLNTILIGPFYKYIFFIHLKPLNSRVV